MPREPGLPFLFAALSELRAVDIAEIRRDSEQDGCRSWLIAGTPGASRRYGRYFLAFAELFLNRFDFFGRVLPLADKPQSWLVAAIASEVRL